MMSRRAKRLVAVILFSVFFWGASASLANGTTRWCPYIRFNGAQLMLCVPIP